MSEKSFQKKPQQNILANQKFNIQRCQVCYNKIQKAAAKQILTFDKLESVNVFHFCLKNEINNFQLFFC